MTDYLSGDIKCIFCGSNGENGVNILGKSNGAAICRNCSDTVQAIFQRMDVLSDLAVKEYVSAQADGERYDADGVCRCIGCQMNKLTQNDTFLQDLQKKQELGCEEVSGTKH